MRSQVDVIETTEPGDRSYVAHDGESAVVVDPQRDLARIEAVLADQGLTCLLVLETHIHNDYVTGGLGPRPAMRRPVRGGRGRRRGVVLSGGSLLYGSGGRTDLVDPARTEELARAQFHSVRRLSGISGAEDAICATARPTPPSTSAAPSVSRWASSSPPTLGWLISWVPR